MGQQVNATLHFEQGFKGKLVLRDGEIGIGINDNEARPYDMLQGALAACLHSTFLDILEKKRLTIAFADYEVTGIKRDSVPSMLEEVTITVTLPKGEREEVLRKSMDLASQYCSVYSTLSQVATMHLVVKFK